MLRVLGERILDTYNGGTDEVHKQNDDGDDEKYVCNYVNLTTEHCK